MKILFLLVIILIIIIIFSNIIIEIKEVYINTYNNDNNIYKIYIKLYFLNKILYLKVDIVRLLEKIYINKFKNKKINYSIINKKIKNIKKNKFILEKIKKKKNNFFVFENIIIIISIDTIDIILTSLINFIITMFLTYFYSKIFIINNNSNINMKKKLNNYYKVMSKFEEKNEIMINVKGIINIKMVNAIIIMINFIKQKRKECKNYNE